MHAGSAYAIEKDHVNLETEKGDPGVQDPDPPIAAGLDKRGLGAQQRFKIPRPQAVVGQVCLQSRSSSQPSSTCWNSRVNRFDAQLAKDSTLRKTYVWHHKRPRHGAHEGKSCGGRRVRPGTAAWGSLLGSRGPATNLLYLACKRRKIRNHCARAGRHGHPARKNEFGRMEHRQSGRQVMENRAKPQCPWSSYQ